MSEVETVTRYDIGEFRQAVADSDELTEDHPVTGTPMGVTIETLVDTLEEYETAEIHTSNRTDVPAPIGAGVILSTLSEVAHVLNTLGTVTISNINEDEETGHLVITYHFD